jgi:hypothetical protein
MSSSKAFVIVGVAVRVGDNVPENQGAGDAEGDALMANH